MGLAESPLPAGGNVCDQQNGGSVMNGYCNQNDTGGNMPTDVTPCDSSVVQNPACSDPCAGSTCANFDPRTCANYGEDGTAEMESSNCGCYEVWSVTLWYWCNFTTGQCTYSHMTLNYRIGYDCRFAMLCEP